MIVLSIDLLLSSRSVLSERLSILDDLTNVAINGTILDREGRFSCTLELKIQTISAASLEYDRT